MPAPATKPKATSTTARAKKADEDARGPVAALTKPTTSRPTATQRGKAAGSATKPSTSKQIETSGPAKAPVMKPVASSSKTSAKTRPVSDKALMLATRPPKPSSETSGETASESTLLSDGNALDNIMAAYNEASHEIAALVQSGWKASTSTSKGKAVEVKSSPRIGELASTCLKSLERLRALGMPGKAQDIEKAAVSLVVKLVALELFSQSLEALKAIKPQLLRAYHHDGEVLTPPSEHVEPNSLAPKRSSQKVPQCAPGAKLQPSSSNASSLSNSSHLHCLPLPKDPSSMTPDLLNITTTFQVYAITTLARLWTSDTLPVFDEVLSCPGNILDWYPIFSHPTTGVDTARQKQLLNNATRAAASVDTDSPLAQLKVRLWAMKCLGVSGAVDSGKFWDQSVACVKFYLSKTDKTATKDSDSSTSRHASDYFDTLIAYFEHVADDPDSNMGRSDLLAGPGFTSACEYWMRHAKFLNDILLISQISSLLLGGTRTSNPSPGDELSSHLQSMTIEEDPPALSLPQLRIILDLATSILKSLVSSDTVLCDKRQTDHLAEVIAALPQCVAPSIRFLQGGDDAAEKKVYKAVDGFSRACDKVMRSNLSEVDGMRMDESTSLLICKLMDAVATFGSQVLGPCEGGDPILRYTNDLLENLLDGTLDAFFVLAKRLLSNTRSGKVDPSSAHKSYDILSRAMSITYIVDAASKLSTAGTPALRRYAETLRALSAAFHNAAAVFLNSKQEVASTEFWRRAAELGTEAVKIWDNLPSEDADESETKNWNTLREVHLASRWEFLAHTLSRSGKRRLAYEGYLRSIETRPKSFYANLVVSAGSTPIIAVFERESKLAAIVDRLTSLAVFDGIPQESDDLAVDGSLRHPLTRSGLPLEAIGAILEYQVVTLDSVAHKEEATTAMRSILKDLKEIYGGTSDFPIRRARVLLRSLELAYATDDSSSSASHLVIHGLLSSKNLGADSHLAPFVPQHSASLEVLLSIQAHRQQDREYSIAIILQHSAKAINSLRAILDVHGGAHASGEPVRTLAPKIKKVASIKPVASGGARSAKGRPPPKTPKRPNAASLVEPTWNLKLEDDEVIGLVLDNPDQFFRHLESLAQLLGLLGHFLPKLEVLDLTYRLSEAALYSSRTETYWRSSGGIANEYFKLGKFGDASTILGKAVTMIPNSQTGTEESRIILLLRYAESLAVHGDDERGLQIYSEALRLAEDLTVPDKSSSTMTRIRYRLGSLEMSALASQVYATVQLCRDNVTGAILGLMQALRLWNRALDTLTRVHALSDAPMTGKVASPNPFQVALPGSESSSSASRPRSSKQHRDAFMDGTHWRITDGLMTTLFKLARIHHDRGSVKTTEYFLQRIEDLADGLNAPVLGSRGLARKAEKELALGNLHASHELLIQASHPWQQVPDAVGLELVEVHRLQANHSLRGEEHDDAKRTYGLAFQMLEKLEETFASTEMGLSFSSPLGRRTSQSLATSAIAPRLFASVLRQHIWLLRDEAGEDPLYDQLLQRFLALPSSIETKIEENALMGKLAFEEVLVRLDQDLFLHALIESAIATPMGMSSPDGVIPPTSTREIMTTLTNAERFFWSGLELSFASGHVSQVREAALSLMLIRAYQSSLGKGGRNSTMVAVSLLDLANGITLRRELLECIENKLRDPSRGDDTVWPTMNANGSPLQSALPTAKRINFAEDSDDDDEEGDPKFNPELYWQSVRSRYKAETIDPAALASPQVDALPAHWTVVTISVTDDKRTILISRQRPHAEALIFCLPLDRQGRREGAVDEDEHFSYDNAVDEFLSIIHESDEMTQNAKKMVSKEDRVEWWASRVKLDSRMKALVENMEYCWLGGFKTILHDPSCANVDGLNALRIQLEKVFKRNGVTSSDKRAQLRPRLDDTIVECFSTLSPKCRDEELEDLVYFVLDLYQLHGCQVALSEIDVDQVAVDLRTVLEEHAAKRRGKPTETDADRHLFLVLDKHVQGLPWESIPSLRGRPVSRIPSLSFLIDRVELARLQHPSGPNPPDRINVDPLKTFFVLNPSGDLATTQTTYEEGFKSMEASGWTGIVGRAPSEGEMVQGLQGSDLVLYFGHGAGQEYIRSHKIRHLQRCAATMLWGCSSGVMKDMGDFERVGTPNHYMLAGCPTLVVNLWDVTDREIDRVAQAVLGKMKLDVDHLGKSKSKKSKVVGDETEMSVVRAVAESREACKLKYLTGAAPVVYGIPFYL